MSQHFQFKPILSCFNIQNIIFQLIGNPNELYFYNNHEWYASMEQRTTHTQLNPHIRIAVWIYNIHKCARKHGHYIWNEARLVICARTHIWGRRVAHTHREARIFMRSFAALNACVCMCVGHGAGIMAAALFMSLSISANAHKTPSKIYFLRPWLSA
jgi:hypothetical protein